MPGEKSSAGGPVLAYCPHCEKYHKIRIALELGGGKSNRLACAWTGHGIPWKYCYDCKIKLGMIPSTMFPAMNYDIIERGKL
ncbi:MAG: hypothetical protein WC450_11575 [Candidatus Omnitrophota bacterium]|jgi:hypothetical protein